VSSVRLPGNGDEVRNPTRSERSGVGLECRPRSACGVAQQHDVVGEDFDRDGSVESCEVIRNDAVVDFAGTDRERWVSPRLRASWTWRCGTIRVAVLRTESIDAVVAVFHVRVTDIETDGRLGFACEITQNGKRQSAL